jgi:solute carrier family 25 (mitochondrial phosphate transporter), member 23/24/25/41
MYCIVRKEGASDLYRSIGPSCIKLMSTAGISLMCCNAYKRILVEGEEEIDDVDDEEKNIA